MRLFVVGAAYGLWLLATEVIFYIAHGIDETSLESAVVLGALPAVLQLLLLGFNPYGLLPPVRTALYFVLIVLLSFIFNRGSWTSFIYVIEVVFTFALAILVAGCPDRRLIRVIAAQYSLPGALFLIYVYLTGEHVLGRLSANGIQPNFWGLMGVAVIVMGFGHRWRLLTLFCMSVGALVIYDASSRSSMLAVFGAVMAVVLLYIPTLRGARLLTAVGATLVGVVVLAFPTPFFDHSVLDLVGNILKIDDPNRGLGSGFTGREAIWQGAIDLWLSSPLVGVGFHQHAALVPGSAGAHDAYLGMLADTGILGLAWYVAFLLISLYKALDIEDRSSRNATVATMVGYMILGLFEARSVNGGNPMSLFWQFSCFFALAQWKGVFLRPAAYLPPLGTPPLARPSN